MLLMDTIRAKYTNTWDYWIGQPFQVAVPNQAGDIIVPTYLRRLAYCQDDGRILPAILGGHLLQDRGFQGANCFFEHDICRLMLYP